MDMPSAPLADRRADLSLLGVLMLSSAASVFLVAARVVHTHRLAYAFLVWNLLLAWVPLGLAALIHELHRARRRAWPTMAALGLVWLLFLPNSAYIVTDLLHLVRPKAGAPLWYDAVLVFSFAWNGLVVGLVSLHLVHRVAEERIGILGAWAMVLAVTLVSAFGIYVGRFDRWNSWDLVRWPRRVIVDVLPPLLDPAAGKRAVAVTLLLSGFLLLAYMTLRALVNLRPTTSARVPAPAAAAS